MAGQFGGNWNGNNSGFQSGGANNGQFQQQSFGQKGGGNGFESGLLNLLVNNNGGGNNGGKGAGKGGDRVFIPKTIKLHVNNMIDTRPWRHTVEIQQDDRSEVIGIIVPFPGVSRAVEHANLIAMVTPTSCNQVDAVRFATQWHQRVSFSNLSREQLNLVLETVVDVIESFNLPQVRLPRLCADKIGTTPAVVNAEESSNVPAVNTNLTNNDELQRALLSILQGGLLSQVLSGAGTNGATNGGANNGGGADNNGSANGGANNGGGVNNNAGGQPRADGDNDADMTGQGSMQPPRVPPLPGAAAAAAQPQPWPRPAEAAASAASSVDISTPRGRRVGGGAEPSLPPSGNPAPKKNARGSGEVR